MLAADSCGWGKFLKVMDAKCGTKGLAHMQSGKAGEEQKLAQFWLRDEFVYMMVTPFHSVDDWVLPAIVVAESDKVKYSETVNFKFICSSIYVSSAFITMEQKQMPCDLSAQSQLSNVAQILNICKQAKENSIQGCCRLLMGSLWKERALVWISYWLQICSVLLDNVEEICSGLSQAIP